MVGVRVSLLGEPLVPSNLSRNKQFESHGDFDPEPLD